MWQLCAFRVLALQDRCRRRFIGLVDVGTYDKLLRRGHNLSNLIHHGPEVDKEEEEEKEEEVENDVVVNLSRLNGKILTR